MDVFRNAKCLDCKGTLHLIESNYSGCGVDMVECRKCKHVFQVSYKVDQVIRVSSWE